MGRRRKSRVRPSKLDAALAALGIKKERRRKGKIPIPLQKKGKANVKRGRRELMKPLASKKIDRKARSGPNPFGALQSAGMPGNEEADPFQRT
jgi:hypothetical protein